MKRYLTVFITIVAMAISGVFLAGSAASRQQAGTAGAIPKGWYVIPPDQLKWAKLDDGTGRQIANVVGDRLKPDQYIQFVKWPPHTMSKAHSHPDERYGVVLSDTFYFGHGDKFDVSKLEKLLSATFFIEPAGVGHFGATTDEEAILYFVGTGPSRTDQIEKRCAESGCRAQLLIDPCPSPKLRAHVKSMTYKDVV